MVGIFFGGGADGWKHLGIQALGLLILTGISLGATYVIVMLVDFLFGFRCSRACELIGLDFWEHQFDDGSLQTNNDKATLFGLAQMRADLSRRTRHLDSVVPNKWRSPSKSYMDVTASETSSSSDVFPLPAVNAGISGINEKDMKDGDRDKAAMHKLAKKVEQLEHKIALLTVGMLRDKSKTSEDICGTRPRYTHADHADSFASQEAEADESPVAPIRTTKSDRI